MPNIGTKVTMYTRSSQFEKKLLEIYMFTGKTDEKRKKLYVRELSKQFSRM